MHDRVAYARAMLTLRSDAQLETLAIKLLDCNSVCCRPGTSDPWVLWDVFHHQYQAVPGSIGETACIVDLGANVGYTTAYFAARHPNATIVAIEMDEANFQLACRNVAPWANRCRMVHAAVWDSDGELEYHGREEQGYRVAQLDGSASFVDTRRVTAKSLMSLFNEYGLERVDFLKMDIEGAEEAVFRGNLDWLPRVKALKVELHPPMTYETCAGILSRHGYSCRPDAQHDHCLIAVRDGSDSAAKSASASGVR
jgi:FkbM family methyltransferase